MKEIVQRDQKIEQYKDKISKLEVERLPSRKTLIEFVIIQNVIFICKEIKYITMRL